MTTVEPMPAPQANGHAIINGTSPSSPKDEGVCQ